MDCYHCGETCLTLNIKVDEKVFCCNGCKTVFEILSANNLNNYYSINSKPGIKVGEDSNTSYFDFLDLDEVKARFILYSDGQLTKVEFYIPQIHCNSCIWLLENLSKLNKNISYSEVNFSTKNVQFTLVGDYSIKSLAEFLNKIGYTPDFNEKKAIAKNNKKLIYKIGVAGFCFGNIMLLAFPEYLGLNHGYEKFRDIFLWIMFALSIPVTFYSGNSYFNNAITGVKNRLINMDFPIAIGLLVLFVRSTAELFLYTGQAYFDSLAGLIFFLLIGKWLQDKVFSNLTFDRDYKSFFPIAIQRLINNKVEITKIESLEIGDVIRIRHQELIPADGVLVNGSAKIDYSFVTGESKPENITIGNQLFAGGKQVGDTIEIQIIKKTNNSYLTGLWNSKHVQKKEEENRLSALSANISKYFTIIILLLSIATVVGWYFIDPSFIWKSVTAVLIVACPCALALSLPFTYGNALKYLSKKKVYFRRTEVIDQLSTITDIVFDKTGTLTNDDEIAVKTRSDLSTVELSLIKKACSTSLHPISQAIAKSIQVPALDNELESFEEVTGKGIVFKYKGDAYKVGSAKFVNTQNSSTSTQVFFSKNESILGFFDLQHNYRDNLKLVLEKLAVKYNLHVLSGDNDKEKEFIQQQFKIQNAYFNQEPKDKLEYIEALKKEGRKVLMIGDGLNDAGALLSSNVGIAISNKVHSFTPASDAILESTSFEMLPQFLSFSHYCRKVVVVSFIISFLYNIIGLSIAVQGIFAPVLAAVLMPLSSISVVLFTTLFISIYAKVKFKK